MNNLNKFLFVILSSDKYVNDRVHSIKNTWSLGLNKIFLVDKEINEDYLMGYGVPPVYESIQIKYINFFKNYDFNSYDYYFFSDDDTFINLKNLLELKIPKSDALFCICRKLLLNSDGSDMFGRNTGYPMFKISGNNTSLPLNHPSGGSGFIMSKITCNKIKQYLNLLTDNEIPKSGHGDVTIGFWLRNINCEIINNDNFWYETPENLLNDKYSSYSYENDLSFITYHYVSPTAMYNYNEKYNK